MSNQLIENVHYYINESGLMVFTEKYHLQRGYCCGNGCTNCPYNFDAVEEPRRTMLLQQKQTGTSNSEK